MIDQGLIKWLIGKFSTRRKKISEMLNWFSNWKAALDSFDDKIRGVDSFSKKIINIEKDVAVVAGKLATIEATINTIFLIVDRTFGRNKNKKVKIDRRK